MAKKSSQKRSQSQRNPNKKRNPSQKRNPTQKRSPKKKNSTKKRKLNAYMVAKEKARLANSPNFNYNGNTYHRAQTETGMVIYKKNN